MPFGIAKSIKESKGYGLSRNGLEAGGPPPVQDTPVTPFPTESAGRPACAGKKATTRPVPYPAGQHGRGTRDG